MRRRNLVEHSNILYLLVHHILNVVLLFIFLRVVFSLLVFVNWVVIRGWLVFAEGFILCSVGNRSQDRRWCPLWLLKWVWVILIFTITTAFQYFCCSVSTRRLRLFRIISWWPWSSIRWLEASDCLSIANISVNRLSISITRYTVVIGWRPIRIITWGGKLVGSRCRLGILRDSWSHCRGLSLILLLLCWGFWIAISVFLLLFLFLQLSFTKALIRLYSHSLLCMPVLCHHNFKLPILWVITISSWIARVIVWVLTSLINLLWLFFKLCFSLYSIWIEEVLLLLTPSVCFVGNRDAVFWNTSLLWSIWPLLVEIRTSFYFIDFIWIRYSLSLLSMLSEVLLSSFF